MNQSPAMSVGVFGPMTLSVTSIITTMRTTVCDIMCTTNTHREYIEVDNVPETLRKKVAKANLPYRSNAIAKMPKGDTQYLQLRNSQVLERKCSELKEEKRLFFENLEKERSQKRQMERECVTRIQAVFRGHRTRNKSVRSQVNMTERISFRRAALDAMSIQDELCRWAQMLNLEPIPGLSLENRIKQNRRKQRIEFAATLRLQSFFRMLRCVIQTRRKLIAARNHRNQRASLIIQRFFRWVVKQQSKAKTEEQQRTLAAVVIETRYRMFVARKRFV